MDIRFSTVFRNSEGVEIAGTWLDLECGAWAVSTVPVTRFSREQEANRLFSERLIIVCSPHTIRNPSSHRRRSALQAGMLPARVVEREVERQRCLQVIPVLA